MKYENKYAKAQVEMSKERTYEIDDKEFIVSPQYQESGANSLAAVFLRLMHLE